MKTHVDFLDPVALTTGNLPLDSLLDNSVYYPASGYDGDLIRLFNKILTEKGVRSFVYCDYESTEEKVISNARSHMRGYHILAHRSVDISELLGPGADSRYLLPVGRCQKAKRGDGFFCHWFIFERDRSFAESHGPERFSLMYICAEGVSAYELLYSSRGIAPKCVAIIQPGEGFGGNWTDFHKVGAPLYQALKRNPGGLPEMIVNGGNWERDWSRGYEDLSWEEYQAGECINDYYYPGYGQVVIYHLKQEFSHHRTDEAVTGNSSVSIGYKTTTDMKRTFDINLVDGHLLISDNGNTILVDTGSPLTVHQEDTLCFLGREFPVHTSIMGDGIGSLCRLSGIEFTTLLGMDILSQYRVVFDYDNRQITFLTDEESGLEGTTIPLVNVMGGVKAVTMQINGQQLKVAIDTGAPLSYVDTMVTDGLEPVGEKEDFHPMAGRYTTPVFQLEAVLGGKRFTGSYGNLPAMMGMSLQLMGLDGVVGYDFFRSFKIQFDFRNSSLVIA